MPIVELGHVGLWVEDLAVMTDFYERVLGLKVTDRSERHGMVFLSSRPGTEHHELVLADARDRPSSTTEVHQISWRVDSLESLREFHLRFENEGVRVQQEVTHGNAYGIYFFDPEGNRNEVYLRVDSDVPQPFRKSIDFGKSATAVLFDAARLLEDGTEDYQPEE